MNTIGAGGSCSRRSEPEGDGGEPAPYSYVPFGAGRRNCIDFTLATLELQVAAVRLAQRCRWRVDTDEPRSGAAASFAPAGGMPITVQ